jgi:hypothetical protein
MLPAIASAANYYQKSQILQPAEQLGERTNIALPPLREEIINEYQSTPNRELSPPIDREEEKPPPRNYSLTSKVSPTYASFFPFF